MDSTDTEFEQSLGDSEGQGNLACCSPWGHKESDTTERLSNRQFNKIRTSQFSQQHCLQQPSHGSKLSIHQQMNGF